MYLPWKPKPVKNYGLDRRYRTGGSVFYARAQLLADTQQQQQQFCYHFHVFGICYRANTGQSIGDFGNNGKVDLRAGLGRDINKISVYAPSPVIFDDLIIIGTAVNETFGAAPGDIRAYNTVTGELVWRFHTAP